MQSSPASQRCRCSRARGLSCTHTARGCSGHLHHRRSCGRSRLESMGTSPQMGPGKPAGVIPAVSGASSGPALKSVSDAGQCEERGGLRAWSLLPSWDCSSNSWHGQEAGICNYRISSKFCSPGMQLQSCWPGKGGGRWDGGAAMGAEQSPGLVPWMGVPGVLGQHWG